MNTLDTLTDAELGAVCLTRGCKHERAIHLDGTGDCGDCDCRTFTPEPGQAVTLTCGHTRPIARTEPDGDNLGLLWCRECDGMRGISDGNEHVYWLLAVRKHGLDAANRMFPDTYRSARIEIAYPIPGDRDQTWAVDCRTCGVLISRHRTESAALTARARHLDRTHPGTHLITREAVRHA